MSASPEYPVIEGVICLWEHAGLVTVWGLPLLNKLAAAPAGAAHVYISARPTSFFSPMKLAAVHTALASLYAKSTFPACISK